MDTSAQSLNDLAEIRRLLHLIVQIGIVVAVAVVVRTLLFAWSTWREIRKDGFEVLTSTLYRDGKVDRLVEVCRERLSSHPRDVYAHYYLGVVAFDRQQFADARLYFDKTLALAPAWRSSVAGYLEKMSAHDGA